MSNALQKLAEELFDAKRKEEGAKKARIAVEEKIIALVPSESAKGSKTVDTENGVKIVVTRGLSYKADIDAIRKLTAEALPLKFIPEAYELDEPAYEKLRESNPNLFALVAKHVTTKPKKTSVELKLA